MIIKDKEGEFFISHTMVSSFIDGSVIIYTFNIDDFINFVAMITIDGTGNNKSYSFSVREIKNNYLSKSVPLLLDLTEEEYFLFSTEWGVASSLELMHSFQEYVINSSIVFEIPSFFKNIKLRY